MLIDTLYIDPDVDSHPVVQEFRRRLGITGTTVSDPEEIWTAVRAADDPEARGKRVLHLTRNRGAFVKRCPGTRHYTCCGYRILHVASYCTMDCAYCILQSYFHPPVLRYFVNREDLMAELDAVVADGYVHRFGTGEFTDSLIWDAWTDLSPELVRRFAAQPTSVLELKTKTARVDHLVGLPHGGRTILAWSLNTERVIREQERGTAPLEARLRAAAAAASAGYPVAFHFDPLVIYAGCEAEYRGVIERMFDAVGPDPVVWVSLGALRFMPGLKATVERRFPGSTMVYGEFVPGLDGKMRYFKPLRMQLFRSLGGTIRARAPRLCTYLCMEDDEVWRHALGFAPAERGGLSRMLDEAAVRHCGVRGELSAGGGGDVLRRMTFTLAALWLLLQLSTAAADELTTVKRANDGDTVKLADGRSVRYIGVNTPEIDHEQKSADPFAVEAQAFNARLVEGQVVRLELDLERQDSYGRTLAYVHLPDGSMVNERLLLAGLAYCFYKTPNTRHEQRLLAAQRRAMQEGRGMWRNWHEKQARYTGNSNTRRFHRQGCPEARRVSARNRVTFTSRWAAFLAGYAPSRECLPLGYLPQR